MSFRSKKSVKPKNNFQTNRAVSSALLLAAGLFLLPLHSAHAYVDPGTGSMLFQVLIGVIVGIAFAIKSFWGGIVATLKGQRKSTKDTSKDKAAKEETKEKTE
jgi:hypothetical protein